MLPLLVAGDIRHGYRGEQVLSGVDLSIYPGQVVGLVGRSGSGKSTLLHILAGLIAPDGGEVHFDGGRIDSLPERERAMIRLSRFGFVFQSSGLVPEFTAIENVELPALLLGWPRQKARRHAMDLLEELEVADQASKRLTQISGGQYQRVAVARALVHSPDLLFADEPTGSLDETSADLVLTALLESSKRRRAAVMLVSHDAEVTRHSDVLVTLRGGHLE